MSEQETAGRNLGRYFKGQNFVAPYIVEYGHLGDHHVYELAEGTSPWGDIFGVTVVDTRVPWEARDMSHDTGLDSLREARDYVAKLAAEFAAEVSK